MKKQLVLLLCSLLAFLAVTTAQPSPPSVGTLGPIQFLPTYADVRIISPVNSGDYSNPIHLIFTIEVTGLEGQFGNVGISIDNGIIRSITNFVEKTVVQSDADEPHWLKTTVLANIQLESLTEGEHKITVYYGWQYVAPSPVRYQVGGYSTSIFNVVGSQAYSLNTVDSDIGNYMQPEILQSSPTNKTYRINQIPLNFIVSHIQPLATEANIYYSLDGKGKVSVASINESRIDFIKDDTNLSGLNVLSPLKMNAFHTLISNLSDGSYNLTVCIQVTYLHYGMYSKYTSIQFTVDTTPPRISELSISNKTYNNQDIPLSFSLNETTSWIAYNLDNHGNITLQGNTTLSGLSFGSHNVVIYANDTSGNIGEAGPIYFEVKPAEFLTFANLIIIVVIVAFVISLLLFRRHRKTINQSK